MYDLTSCNLFNTNIPDGDRIVLWRVRGIPGYYPSKLIAETAARLSFPHEIAHVRYGRVHFVHFIKED